VGTADIYYAEEKIGTINLVAGQSIDSSAALVFLDAAKNFLTSSFMKVIYVLVAITVIVFLSAVIVLNKGKKKQRKVRYMPITKEERSEWDRK
jgi:D-alanyl-D-alanine carboxypeptidase (penicillin-binding protein 5/6)